MDVLAIREGLGWTGLRPILETMAEAPDVRLMAAELGRYDVEGFCFVSQSLRHAI